MRVRRTFVAGDADGVVVYRAQVDPGSERMGDNRWRALLDVHDDIARRLLDAHGGTLIKTTGDGLLAVFDGLHLFSRFREHYEVGEVRIMVGFAPAVMLANRVGQRESIAEDPLSCVALGTGRALEEMKTLKNLLINMW